MFGIGLGVGVGRSRFAGSFADAYNTRVLANGGTIESLSCVSAASTLLQQASLLFIPSGYKAGVAYSALPNSGNGDLTWSRNSTAYRTQSDGTIGSVAANVPRLSYMYGSCPAALLEPQRTNLFKNSEDFTTINWSPGNSTITANSTTAPDGTNTADTLSDTITASNNSYTTNQGISWTSGTTYTMSVYAKNIDRRYIYLRFVSTAFTINLYAYFDLQNGVVVSASAGVTAKIESAANGFYRCIATATATATASANGIIGLSADGTTNVYTNPSVKSVYIWGAQLEAGSYSTTYIPTTTASVTRLADSFTRNNIYTNGLISAAGGTWYVELRNNVAYVRDAVTGLIIADSTTYNSGNQIIIRSTSTLSARIGVVKYVAGVGSNLYTTTTDVIKIAIKWNGSTADVFVNGVKQVSATSFTATNMEYLYGSIGQPNFIQAMALYNAPLSDTDCVTLTT